MHTSVMHFNSCYKLFTDNISVYTRGDLPQPDTDVYINYTSQGYADVEPANVTWEGVYSSLS